MAFCVGIEEGEVGYNKPMDSRQRQSFTGFTFAFVAVVALAFGVLVWAGVEQQRVAPVDNLAQPY